MEKYKYMPNLIRLVVIKMRTRKNLKEAQGRANRYEGELTKAKIQNLLREQPLTFGQLAEKAKLSKPIIWKYLERLRKEKLIEKTIKDNKVVYQIVSEEKTKESVMAVFFYFLSYVLGGVSAETKKSIEKLVEEAMKKPSESTEIPSKPIEIIEAEPKENGD